ncbi:hypothetical protein RJ641_029179, partial [Dillenia turbinata]
MTWISCADVSFGNSEYEYKYLRWLDSKKPSSVLYLCFGSLARFSRKPTKLVSELEDLGRSFPGPVRIVLSTGNEEVMVAGRVQRENKQQGKAISSASQFLILEHKANGGLLTHCGWNSILEGEYWHANGHMANLCRAILNQELVTQSAKVHMCMVMDEGIEAEGMRKRARQLGEWAKEAVDIFLIVEEIR